MSECVSEEIRRPNSLPRGLVEHWKFLRAETDTSTLARRFAAAGFFFSLKAIS